MRRPFGAPPWKFHANIAVEHVIDGVALQASDFNGLLPFFVHHAGAFAKHFRGADTSAAFSQNICFEDDAGRPANIGGHDAFDEAGNVDPGGTGNRARGIKAIETPRGLDGRLPRIHRRRDVGKNLFSYCSGVSLGAVSRSGMRSPLLP